MFRKLIFALTLMCPLALSAQSALEYQKPSAEILELVDVKLAPRTIIDDAQENMILLYRDNYKSIEELSKEELRLAGLRIDPKTNIGSRVTYFNELKVQRIDGGKILDISGMPENPRIANLRWSPSQSHIAFTNTTSDGVYLWVLDVKKASATQLSTNKVNANMGSVINWHSDGQSILVKMVPESRKALIDTSLKTPTGPTISVSDGKKAQNRTYQDLLKNKNDEFNFEQLAHSELHLVSLNKKSKAFLPSKMYGNVSFSPSGDYVLVQAYSRPFSYLVPYRRFPSQTDIYTDEGTLVKTVVKVPLIEDLPKGFMAVRKGPRNVQWRNDVDHTVVYAEALDEGDPEVEVAHRDQLMALAAPFKAEPSLLMKTINRFYRVTWGDSETAVAVDYWWNTRNTKTYLFNPQNADETRIVFDRNYQDRYSDPGQFVTAKNKYSRDTLVLDDSHVFLLGDGFSEKGQFPFLDKLNLGDLKTSRVYESTYTDKLEDIYDFNIKHNRLLVRIESKTEYPNFYFRDLGKDNLTALTNFENPFSSIQNVQKEVITYKREDGLDLSGTLYLPIDYKKGEKYPMLMWAYPEEFKDKSSAGQNTTNPNRFVYPWYGSPIYWITKGYVVLDDASFPIVGEGDEEPNDTFRSQLVANAKAAIDDLDARNLIDTDRVAVGGHSYGAFMVANLLSHSNLFAAGIARSGAYNRNADSVWLPERREKLLGSA